MMKIMIAFNVIALSLTVGLLDLDRGMVDAKLTAQSGGLLEYVLRTLGTNDVSTHSRFSNRK